MDDEEEDILSQEAQTQKAEGQTPPISEKVCVGISADLQYSCWCLFIDL